MYQNGINEGNGIKTRAYFITATMLQNSQEFK